MRMSGSSGGGRRVQRERRAEVGLRGSATRRAHVQRRLLHYKLSNLMLNALTYSIHVV